MESFKRRLKYYGIGFGLGLIFVLFFFQNRGCSWLPSNRIKNALLDRLIVVSENTQKRLDEKKISDDDLLEVLNTGDVEFNESDRDAYMKIYILEKDGEYFAFTLPKESFVSEVFVGIKNSKKVSPSVDGNGRIIHFPKDEDLVYPDSNSVVTCQQAKLKLINPREILNSLKHDGRLNFSKSNFKESPKPMHYLVFTRNGKEIGAKAIWYKNKINITQFEAEGLEVCN